MAVDRSETAYGYYLVDRSFFKAQRIYSANLMVYGLLESYMFEAPHEKEHIFQYLFHLDDWFGRFDFEVSSRNPAPEDHFVFERIEGAIAYPKDFVSNLKRNA
ncbi:hypothetical protein [Altibacter sp.]|uniref:hypothetical protein n=1 Tax=Altibacter sp. TaxID=2024823 RepID=UPI0025BA70A8|nr:hypothetical protein [Altibacter sp.]